MPRPLRTLLSFLISLPFWAYFTLGWALFFFPRLLYRSLSCRGLAREAAFQGLTHRFFALFFRLARLFLPGLRLEVDPVVRGLRGAVVVANHISYLDSILMVSLLPRQKTVAKPALFRVPFMGWMFRNAGYIPADPSALMDPGQVQGWLAGLREHFAQGGTLFVFPEGTRGDGLRLGPLKKGAFSIARQCRAPVVVLGIRNTHRLHSRRWWMFNAFFPNTVQVRLLATLEPDYEAPGFSQAALVDQVQQILRTFVEGEGSRAP